MNHVIPLSIHQSCGLGRFAEQIGEEIHATFQKKYVRYKSEISYPDHGAKFKKAECSCGLKRLYLY